jgi:hypothetical protein
VLKNKHPAVRQGNINSKLKAPSLKENTPSAQHSAFSFELSDVRIYKSHSPPDHGARRGFSTPCPVHALVESAGNSCNEN